MLITANKYHENDQHLGCDHSQAERLTMEITRHRAMNDMHQQLLKGED